MQLSEQIKAAIAEVFYKHGHDLEYAQQELYNTIAATMLGLTKATRINYRGFSTLANSATTYRELLSIINNEMARLHLLNDTVEAQISSGSDVPAVEPDYNSYPALFIYRQHNAPVFIKPISLN